MFFTRGQVSVKKNNNNYLQYHILLVKGFKLQLPSLKFWHMEQFFIITPNTGHYKEIGKYKYKGQKKAENYATAGLLHYKTMSVDSTYLYQ